MSLDLSFSESDDAIDIVCPMPVGKRVLFAAIALFPLIAPYELLISIRWTDWLNIPFLFAALISVGALVLSTLLLFAAVAGLEQRIHLDKRSRTLTYARSAPIVPFRSATVSFDAVREVCVVTHSWTDGPNSYSLEIRVDDGRRFPTASIEAREDIERHAARIRNCVFDTGAS